MSVSEQPHFSTVDVLLWSLRRDFALVIRRKGDFFNPLVFFMVIVTLFPLGIGSDPLILQTIAPGVIWIGALLSSLLSLEPLFRSDFDDGVLEQMAISGTPLTLIVLSKIIVHWLVTGLPLVLMAPLFGITMSLSGEVNYLMTLTLLLGTPVFSLIGSIGIGLTVGLQRGGLLMPLLVMPFYIPVLVIGAGTVTAASAGLPVDGQLYLLAAFLVFGITLAPLATAASLRVSLG